MKLTEGITEAYERKTLTKSKHRDNSGLTTLLFLNYLSPEMTLTKDRQWFVEQ